MIANLRVVRTAFELELKQQAVDLFMVFGVVIQPLLIAIMAIYMLLERDPSRGIYVVVGSGMTGLWSSLLFSGTFHFTAAGSVFGVKRSRRGRLRQPHGYDKNRPLRLYGCPPYRSPVDRVYLKISSYRKPIERVPL